VNPSLSVQRFTQVCRALDLYHTCLIAESMLFLSFGPKPSVGAAFCLFATLLPHVSLAVTAEHI
jgi:hypothetical protein